MANTTPLSFAQTVAACRKESNYPNETHRKSHRAGWLFVRGMTDEDVFAVAGGEPTYTKTVVKMAKWFVENNKGADLVAPSLAPTETLGDRVARLTAELQTAVEESAQEDAASEAAYGPPALPAPVLFAKAPHSPPRSASFSRPARPW